MDLGLDGVPAAVAGASSGLGLAVARELASEGAEVAICSRSKERIARASSSIGAVGMTADVSTSAGAHGFVQQAAEALGGLQVLVTNAGGPTPGPPSSFGEEQWLEALRLNFFSTVNMARAALAHLRERPWGRIVCITSNVVKQPDPALSLSAAARSAATSFAKTLSDEVGAEGITVNCAVPGQILTDRLRSLAGAPDDAGPDHLSFQAMAEKIPAGRVGTPEEFAAAVVFMCSARASFINGVSLAVDGGFIRSLV